MSNLTLFQRKLNPSNVISPVESQNIKGGIRFFTESQKEFDKMIKKLKKLGIKFSSGSSDKGWCIDW